MSTHLPYELRWETPDGSPRQQGCIDLTDAGELYDRLRRKHGLTRIRLWRCYKSNLGEPTWYRVEGWRASERSEG